MAAIIAVADHDDVGVNSVVGRMRRQGIDVAALKFGLPSHQTDIHFSPPHVEFLQGGRRLTSQHFEEASFVIFHRWRMAPHPAASVTGDLEELGPAERLFAEGEWDAALFGVLAWLEHRSEPGTWINPVHREALLRSRIGLLSIAFDRGLRIPPFAVATRFAALPDLGHGIVAKAVNSNEYLADGRHFPTTVVQPETASELLANRAPCPSFVQRRIEPTHELRIYVMLDEVLCIRVRSHRAYEDIRLLNPKDVTADVVDCPRDLRSRLVGLQRALGIAFCAYDVLVDAGGQEYLVDITPNGSWHTFDELVQGRVSDFLADCLIRQIVRQ